MTSTYQILLDAFDTLEGDDAAILAEGLNDFDLGRADERDLINLADYLGIEV